MRKRKGFKVIFKLIAVFALVCAAVGLSSCKKKAEPVSVTIDFSQNQGEITHGATGFLYGLSEPEIPSGALLAALEPAVLSTKVAGGVQHPVGDVTRVAETFFGNGGKNILIYMQDIYPDWYYAFRADYDDRVAETLSVMLELPYADKLIYCPYNEMNNGVWYGDFAVRENRFAFYAAWEKTYRLIKTASPSAVIAGPGHSDYYSPYIAEFLSYCKGHDCLPEVMVWHELYWFSPVGFKENFADYRMIERSLGIPELRVIITEYGTMSDNGTPSAMLGYVAALEECKAEGCIAFWRLADNLCELTADANTPTAAWWVYRAYAEMRGCTYDVTKSESAPYGLYSLAASDGASISVLLGGNTGKIDVNLTKLRSLDCFMKAKSLDYMVERVEFGGLTADAYAPDAFASGKSKIKNGKASITLENTSPTAVYNLIITPSEEKIKDDSCEFYPQILCFEAEDAVYEGKLIEGNEFVYAVSGSAVKIEENGKITFKFSVNEDARYALGIVYATDNRDEEMHRVSSYAMLATDGCEAVRFVLENTLSERSTDCKTVYLDLKAGEHSFELRGETGKNVLDFFTLTRAADYGKAMQYSTKTFTYSDGCFAVVPEAGYYNYEFITGTATEVQCLNGVSITLENGSIYLKKGINLFVCSAECKLRIFKADALGEVISVADAVVTGGSAGADESSPTGIVAKDITSDGFVTWTVNAQTSGFYALTFVYSNPQTGGTHAYNVKLVERSAFLNINGEGGQTLYFRNTYSAENFTVLTVYATLIGGENRIQLQNVGGEALLPNLAALEIAPIQK